MATTPKPAVVPPSTVARPAATAPKPAPARVPAPTKVTAAPVVGRTTTPPPAPNQGAGFWSTKTWGMPRWLVGLLLLGVVAGSVVAYRKWA